MEAIVEYRVCSYRNCSKDITTMRSNAKFCCIKCKRNELKYKQRMKKRIENNKRKDK